MNKQQRLDWLPRVVQDDMAAAVGEPLDAFEGVEDLVVAFQRRMGLTVDGWPGRRTAQALYGSGLSIPRNRHELRKQFGVIAWTRPDPKSRRVAIANDWGKKHIQRFTLHTGGYVRLHRDIGDEFVQLFRVACEASGYTPRSVQTWNPRVIGGTDRLSMHAYGIAADVDPPDNPWGGVILRGPRKGQPSLLRQHPMFAQVFEWAGWTWGGRWRGNAGDDMHFQRKD